MNEPCIDSGPNKPGQFSSFKAAASVTEDAEDSDTTENGARGNSVLDVVQVRKPEDYGEKYINYLDTTDEKQILASNVRALLKAGTVLDIGAGTGDIPEIIGIDRKQYMAIEQKPEFVEILHDKGFDVRNTHFPCELPGSFDNVLMSHVLYNRKQSDAMIDAAWQSVSHGGQLIAITYRDNLDDLSELMLRIGVNRRTDDERFDYLLGKFSSLGNTDVFTARSHIFSPTVEGIASSLSFIATNTATGTPERRAEIAACIVNETKRLAIYWQEEQGQYEFPIDHYFFVTRREGP